jgi:proline dehydrogenase
MNFSVSVSDASYFWCNLNFSDMIDFSNTEIAFAYRSNNELKKAYWLFSMMASPKLVRSGKHFINFFNSVHFPLDWAIKPTIYKQFCGGVTLDKCLP